MVRRHRPLRLGGMALVLALFLGLAGCGIPEAISDPCWREKRAYEELTRLNSGLAERRVDRSSPIRRDATERLAAARAAAGQCALHSAPS